MAAARATIIPTGAANIASVKAAFKRLGVKARLSQQPDAVREHDFVVLPGVGSFGAAMTELRRTGVDIALRERIKRRRPTLAVCLGLQLLAQASDESTGATGLGILPLAVRRFGDTVKVPQFGWNRITALPGCDMLTGGYAYFANSYMLRSIPDGWYGATAHYDRSFVAALEHGPILACQFHPELSGVWGLDLLKRWLERGGEEC